jgi:hypothetical protein
MGLIERARAGNTGPFVFLLMVVVVVVGLVVLGFIDFCPEGFARNCVHVILGTLTGASCECVPE